MDVESRGELGPDGRRLAEEAWGHVAGFAAHMDRRFNGLGFAGAIGERIVRLIGSYDAGRGQSLRSWAFDQARYACYDLGRLEHPKGFRRRPRDAARLKVVTFGGMAGVEPIGSRSSDPPPAFVALEAAAHLLRGLDRARAAVVWESVVEGRTLAEIAADMGISEWKAARIRRQALDELRWRRGVTGSTGATPSRAGPTSANS